MREKAWNGFREGAWTEEINVRDFIQKNYIPYEGDGSFLAGPTERTGRLMKKLNTLFKAEQATGICFPLQECEECSQEEIGRLEKTAEAVLRG